MDLYFQLVLWDDLPDPKGPLSPPILQQAVAEASKQIQVAVIAKALKKGGNGCFDSKTSTGTGKYFWENE